jgi:LPXTG-motif cell wall-anchored protein
MMKRRAIAGIAGLLLLIAGVGTATAQTSPTVTTPTTSTSVAGDSTTTSTTTTTTTTTTTPSTTETTEVDQLPEEVVPTTQARTAVSGDVVSRPLPRTGNDISGTAIFGGALTILGVALALGARKRRNSFDGA